MIPFAFVEGLWAHGWYMMVGSRRGWGDDFNPIPIYKYGLSPVLGPTRIWSLIFECYLHTLLRVTLATLVCFGLAKHIH